MVESTVEIKVPEAIRFYVASENPEIKLLRNAMMIYPLISQNEISHGKAAEMLGMSKLDLISLYGSMGIPYFNMSEDELNDDVATIRTALGKGR